MSPFLCYVNQPGRRFIYGKPLSEYTLIRLNCKNRLLNNLVTPLALFYNNCMYFRR